MDDVNALTKLTDEDLLEQLGHALWLEAGHAAPATRESLVANARDWLKVNLPRAKDAVCGNSVVDAVRDKADEVTLAGAFADIFAASVGFPVPSVVGILIARIGLDRLCDGWVAQVS